MRKSLIASAAIICLVTNISLSSASDSRGKWVNVTPANVDLKNNLDCGNFGTITLVADPARPSNLYTQFHCQGIWKSTDFGQTWSGPINVGAAGAGARGAGGLAIARGPDGGPPILYSAGIRGSGRGFWKSTDGGVTWLRSTVAPGRDQGFYPANVNPHNPDHLLMTAHQRNLIVETRDGGRTWTQVPIAPEMEKAGGTAFVFFVNTGDGATTGQTFLWTSAGTGGNIGTWRTQNGGRSWTRVDGNEHPHGQMQIYQDASGAVFMAGQYSGLGHGVLRSTDFGQTWKHVGFTIEQAIVFGTPNRIYASFAWACADCDLDPNIQSAPVPGVSAWERMPRPTGMAIGAAQAAVVFDGTNYVIVTANWKAGLWRYVE